MALNWLSRRDYSEAQLSQRLARQGESLLILLRLLAGAKTKIILTSSVLSVCCYAAE
ncbi:hypothetical protein [Rheinheimera baltica]|uniref:hypothetical protein n=1 Tax=Rheinheimera baltica TaxID=67576 RepID=UPI003F7F3506